MAKRNDDVKAISILDRWREPTRFSIEVTKAGNCRAEHEKGQKFGFDWNTPKGICSEAFVGMYPILHSLRLLGDMRELGSSKRNERVYTCPSRVVDFKILAHYQCNLCGNELEVMDGDIKSERLENKDENIWARVCEECFDKYKSRKLTW